MSFLRAIFNEADLAVGCGYKYLNGGPGAPAFLYVARALQEQLRSPLSGWFGHAAPFEFGDAYAPAPGIARFQCGTPPILGLAALAEGVAQFDGVDLPALFAKGQALADLYIAEVEALGGMAKAIEAGIPKLRIEEAAARTQARIDRGVQKIVGVNYLRAEHEPPIEILKVDNRAVREAQIARLE